MGWLRRLVLGISPDQVRFARRGFRPAGAEAQQRLEWVGQIFLQGYHAALREDEPEPLAKLLGAVEIEQRGFAFEGAAMGLALLDHLLPWRRGRWRAFLQGPGDAHAYMVHVGAGWALARLPWLRRRAMAFLGQLDPLLGCLAADGYGFHEGYFHWREAVERQAVPQRLTGYARRAFDQGLGRSLWFVDGADVARLPGTIGAFPPERQADLWSGIGLACSYAGGADGSALEALCRAAGPFRPQLAQGAAFAAKARARAGNPATHTETACRALSGLSAPEAAELTDVCLYDLPADGAEPAFEVWRRRIQARFVEPTRRLPEAGGTERAKVSA